MAEAIEQRRVELHLSPGRFARESGLTPAGLLPIRRGYRRNYADDTKTGVARALHWPWDAIDRLMAGESPDTFAPVPAEVPTLEAAIDADPVLNDDQKAMMVAMYRAAVGQART